MRSLLCSHCLALVERGQRCAAHPDLPTVDLLGDSDAARLRRLWTRPRYDRSIGWARIVAQLAAAAGAVGALLFAMSAWHESERPWRETTCYLVPMLALVGLSWTLLGSLERSRRRRYLAVPRVASGPDARPLSGRIVGGGSIAAPVTGLRGCGYGAVLAADALLWHDGESAGVVIETDDGLRLTIPRGPLRIAFRERAGQPASRDQLDALLERYGPGGRAARNRMLVCAPFPFNYYEAALRPGDRVEVVASVRPVPGGSGVGTAYRSPCSQLETTGVPWLRLVRQG